MAGDTCGGGIGKQDIDRQIRDERACDDGRIAPGLAGLCKQACSHEQVGLSHHGGSTKAK